MLDESDHRTSPTHGTPCNLSSRRASIERQSVVFIHIAKALKHCAYIEVNSLQLSFIYLALNLSISSSVPRCACMRLTNRLLNMTREVAATLAVGQRLRGQKGSYEVLEQLAKHRDVWKAM